MNKAILVGNIGQDPDLRDAGGTPKLELRLATSERWVKDGEKQEKTEWHTVVLWGKRASALNWLEKGMKIAVEGRIQTRSYEARDGSRRYATEINANELEVLSSKRDRGYDQDTGEVNGDDIPY